MSRKRDWSELKTDMKDVSLGVAGTTGTADTQQLAHDILQERKTRLQRQNQKLAHEIGIIEHQYGDIGLIKRDVLRANEVVKQSLFGLVVRVAEQLAALDDPGAIQQFLHAALIECFNDLAYEHGRTDTADSPVSRE